MKEKRDKYGQKMSLESCTVCLFLCRCFVFLLDDSCQKRFQIGFKLCKGVYCEDRGESFHLSIYMDLLTPYKTEPCKVCPRSVYRSPRSRPATTSLCPRRGASRARGCRSIWSSGTRPCTHRWCACGATPSLAFTWLFA